MKRIINWIVILCQFSANILIGLQILNRIYSESTKLFILDIKHFFKGSGTYGVCIFMIVLLVIVSSAVNINVYAIRCTLVGTLIYVRKISK